MKSPLKSKDVTVLIVNYRGADNTIECLRSINQLVEAPGRIIVIDNNSNDGSVDKIFLEWRTFARVSIIKSDYDIKINQYNLILKMHKNGGYAYGNNAGIRVAFLDKKCKAVWIINNDTKHDINSLSELCNKYNKSNNNVIIGSTLIYEYNKDIIQCTCGSTFNKFIGTTRHIGEGCNIYSINKFLHKDPDVVNGASMLIPRSVVQHIGFFDEKFFMYYEDVEYCIRAIKSGCKLLWSQKSIVYHKEGASSGAHSKLSGKKQNKPEWVDRLSLRNRLLVIQKHYPIYIPIVILSYIFLITKSLCILDIHRALRIIHSIYAGLFFNYSKKQYL